MDVLKSSRQSTKGKSIGTLAREAIRWAQEALQLDNGSVIGEKNEEVTDKSATGDDAILACCLYCSNNT